VLRVEVRESMNRVEFVKTQHSEETTIERLWLAYWRAEMSDLIRVEELHEPEAKSTYYLGIEKKPCIM